VGRKRHAVNHAVAGIPAPAGTHPVYEHRTPKSKPPLNFLAPDQSSPGSADTRLVSARGKEGCLGATCASVLAMMAVGQFPPALDGAIGDQPPLDN
jgi:hypothetical protein